MPYSSWTDVNPALKGIRPRVSLEQANLIAGWADKITKGNQDSKVNPWAVAISTFKKAYKVVNGKWEKKEVKEMDPETMAEITALLEAELLKGGQPASDFLVVDDSKDTSTWHLPVKKNGKIDHRLMGAAWAALFDPNGFRGKPYAGPNKAGAKSKLKAMYKSEGMPIPGAAAKPKEAVDIEGVGLNSLSQRLYSAFYKLYDMRPDGTRIYKYYGKDVFIGHENFGDAILVSYGSEYRGDDQLFAVPFTFEKDEISITEADQWIKAKMVCVPSDDGTSSTDEPANDSVPSMAAAAESADDEGIDLAETASGVLDIIEDGAAASSSIVPMKMEVQIIRPGWGNSRDNHYYSKEVLKRDAHVFEGVKQYESDHVQSEKNTRTWVSTVGKIKRYADDGAPIAEVIVHDENFAKRVRALKTAGLLNKMECSILAKGMAEEGEVEGRKGNIVKSIVEGRGVDWVTRAGAGGQALNLTELEANEMSEKDPKQTPAPAAAVPAPAAPAAQTPAPVVPVAEVAPVVPAPVPVFLAETEVKGVLDESKLPDAVQAKLLKGQYQKKEEVTAAITAEVEYLKKVTGSGAPFAQGGSAAVPQAMTEKEYAEKLDGIDLQFGLRK